MGRGKASIEIMAYAAIVALVGAGLFTRLFIQPSIMGPLRDLLEAIETPGRRSFATVARDHADNELGDIATALVDMQSDLERANAALEEKIAAVHTANAELRRSNRDLDDFAYIASHDLREPLRGMKNHAQFLLEDYGDTMDEDGIRRLDRLVLLSEKMERLIEDLLRFSRLATEDTAGELVDPHEVIAEVEDRLSDLLRERNAAIVCVSELPFVAINRAHFATVIENLIANGVRYNTADEKRIEIGFLVRATRDGMPRTNVFRVADNGIGIETRHHDEIFRMFRRLHSEKKFGTGTGAGLSFVKKIVESAGGDIWLESEPGRGTYFYLTFNKPCVERRDAA